MNKIYIDLYSINECQQGEQSKLFWRSSGGAKLFRSHSISRQNCSGLGKMSKWFQINTDRQVGWEPTCQFQARAVAMRTAWRLWCFPQLDSEAVAANFYVLHPGVRGGWNILVSRVSWVETGLRHSAFRAKPWKPCASAISVSAIRPGRSWKRQTRSSKTKHALNMHWTCSKHALNMH
jgi:hypothetical protein